MRPQDEVAARPPQDRTLSKRLLSVQRWNYYQDEIYQIYVIQNHTLQETMKMIREKHGFGARYAFLCFYFNQAHSLPPTSFDVVHL